MFLIFIEWSPKCFYAFIGTVEVAHIAIPVGLVHQEVELKFSILVDLNRAVLKQTTHKLSIRPKQVFYHTEVLDILREWNVGSIFISGCFRQEEDLLELIRFIIPGEKRVLAITRWGKEHITREMLFVCYVVADVTVDIVNSESALAKRDFDCVDNHRYVLEVDCADDSTILIQNFGVGDCHLLVERHLVVWTEANFWKMRRNPLGLLRAGTGLVLNFL